MHAFLTLMAMALPALLVMRKDSALPALLPFSLLTTALLALLQMKRHEPNKAMCVSPSIKENRPVKGVADVPRMEKFSFALANMIQMAHPLESQILLQTKDIVKRMEAQKMILSAAAASIAGQLKDINTISELDRAAIQAACIEPIFTMDGIDFDVLPPDIKQAEAEEIKDEWDTSQMM